MMLPMLTLSSSLAKEKFRPRNTNQRWYLKTSKFSARRSSLGWKHQKVYCKQPGLTSRCTSENASEKTSGRWRLKIFKSTNQAPASSWQGHEKPSRRPQQQRKWSCSCHVRDTGQSSLSYVSCEDLLVEAKQAMSSSLVKTKKPQSHETQPCRRCLVLQRTARKTQVGELLSEMSKKAGLATIYISHCLRATSVTILKASGLENTRVKSVTGHKSDSAVESYHKRPTYEQQVQSSAIVSDFVAGSTQCQVSKERALMEIQQNQPVEESGFEVQAASKSSQVASASYVSHVEHSVIPSEESFSAGQFHNCIFNTKYCSNWTRDEKTRTAKCRLFRSRRSLHVLRKAAQSLIRFDRVLERKS